MRHLICSLLVAQSFWLVQNAPIIFNDQVVPTKFQAVGGSTTKPPPGSTTSQQGTTLASSITKLFPNIGASTTSLPNTNSGRTTTSWNPKKSGITTNGGSPGPAGSTSSLQSNSHTTLSGLESRKTSEYDRHSTTPGINPRPTSSGYNPYSTTSGYKVHSTSSGSNSHTTSSQPKSVPAASDAAGKVTNARRATTFNPARTTTLSGVFTASTPGHTRLGNDPGALDPKNGARYPRFTTRQSFPFTTLGVATNRRHSISSQTPPFTTTPPKASPHTGAILSTSPRTTPSGHKTNAAVADDDAAFNTKNSIDSSVKPKNVQTTTRPTKSKRSTTPVVMVTTTTTPVAMVPKVTAPNFSNPGTTPGGSTISTTSRFNRRSTASSPTPTKSEQSSPTPTKGEKSPPTPTKGEKTPPTPTKGVKVSVDKASPTIGTKTTKPSSNRSTTPADGVGAPEKNSSAKTNPPIALNTTKSSKPPSSTTSNS